MKKNYFITLLLTLCFSSISFGQVLLAEGFTYADGSLVGNGTWARAGGTAGDFIVASNKAVVQQAGATSEDVKIPFSSVTGDVYAAFDFSVDDLGAPYSGTDNEYFAHFAFKARLDVVPPSGAGDYSVGISSGGGSAEITWATDLTFGTTYRAVLKYDQVSGLTQLWINPTASTDTSISSTTASISQVGTFDLRQSKSSKGETVRIDDLMVGQTFNDVLVFAAATAPAMSITGVSDHQVLAPNITEANLSFSVQNFILSADNGSGLGDGSGDGFIKTVLKISGESDETASFFTLTPPAIEVVAGKTYTATAELVDNAGNSLSPKVESSVSFRVASYMQVADLTALRASNEGDYYEVTGAVVLTYNTGNNRNQKYIQDSSAGILIDDSAGIITTTYNVGDAGSGLRGKLGSYNGVLQFVPTEDPGAPDATGQSFTTASISLNEFITNFENYESQWVKIQSASFDDADGTAVFDSTNTRNYGITEGADVAVVRIQFDGTDIEGKVIPQGANSITGIAAQFNATLQIFPTQSTGIVLDIENNEISGFSTYPNPITNKKFTISSASSSIKEVSIFNVLGKKVLSSSFSGEKKNVDVSGINAGIYILKVTEDGKTATKKLVIR